MNINDLLLKREQIYQGRVIEVTRETITLPHGGQTELEIVRHPGGAATVALDERHQVCLLRQFRYAGSGWLWELPAGRIDLNEMPFATAVRELAEEAGVQANRWDDLGCMHSSPGIFTEIIYLWLARDLNKSTPSQEQDEVIEVHWINLQQALDWCQDGTITDGKTLIGLYRAAALLSKKS